MYAIVEIGGHQYKVEENQRIFVNRLEGKEGEKVSFNRVLLTENNGSISVGAPVINGIEVNAKIVKQLKADKEIVFKKKRRKGYVKKNGHRQSITELEILAIGLETISKTPKKKTERKKTTEEKKEPKKVAEKQPTVKPEPKKASPAKKSTKSDDLKKIEGIGPKISELLQEAGINTFAELAKTSQEQLKEILANAGSRYVSRNPSTWPTQADLAAKGKWDELKELQDRLKGGIEQ